MKPEQFKNTRAVTEAELMVFMKNKTMYCHQCGWLEKWDHKKHKRYTPWKAFVLRSSHELELYDHAYGPTCLGHRTIKGVPYWKLQRWGVSYNSRNHKYYITKWSAPEWSKK